jgi:DNA repair protein RecN (Recombination protein N)
MIRGGAADAAVEGVFHLSGRKALLAKLKDMGLTLDGGLLILKRQFSKKGESRAYANGSRLTMAQLKEVGDLLVDLHGQHEHQSLLRPAQHMDLLDDYGDLLPMKEGVRGAHEKLTALYKEQERLSANVRELTERRELYEFQLQEIDALQPVEGEDDELEGQKRILENVEQLFEGVNTAHQSLFEEDDSIIARLSSVRSILESLTRTDSNFEKRTEECSALIYQLEDLSAELRQYAQKLRRDPEKLAQMEDRLQELGRLKRKYGGSLSSVVERRGQLVEELNSLTSGDERLEELQREIDAARVDFSKACQTLSRGRQKAASRLRAQVEKQLENLGMPKTRFSVSMEQIQEEDGWVEAKGEKYRADATGMDQIEFLLSPNPGEELRPLAKIASGGEISRIMLAMKTILAQADQIPLLVFDEIDVGIGGQVAQSVGQALKSLAQEHQVMCITHLHQIASLADEHFLVTKTQRAGRTETLIQSLNSPERESEIARMIGGEEITEITLQHAREIIRRGTASEASPR